VIRLLLTKYWVLAHLLVTAGTLCFFPDAPLCAGIWLAASLLLLVLCLPPVLKGESFWMARMRTGRALRGDVVLWSGLVAVVYVLTQCFNGPRSLQYVAELRRWSFTPPPLAALPSSIHPGAAVPFAVGLLGALACAVAIRCALPRKQRLFALIGVGLLSGAAAIAGAVTLFVTGAAPDFAALGGAYDASFLWTLMLCVSLGIMGETFLEHRFATFAWATGAACTNALGVAAFGHMAAVGVAALVLACWLAFAPFAVRASGKRPRILWYVAMLAPLLFAVGVGLSVAPATQTPHAGLNMEQASEALNEFGSQWPFRAGLSWQVLGDNPMLGIGPDGFEQMARFHLKGSHAWGLWKRGGTALPCDFLRLLVERGMIGALLLLLPGAAMLGRCLMRWIEFRQDTRHRYSWRYVFVLAGSLVGVVAMLLASLAGTPLHTPAVLCAFLTVCACLGGWMPRPR